jgi:serine/threonine-protein phosphatase 2A regulatory subunit A
MNEQFNAFTLFKEEMENDEISIRVNATHRAKIVATLMSPDDVKNQLLPFLEGKTKKKTYD